jgi:hypothetical protein
MLCHCLFFQVSAPPRSRLVTGLRRLPGRRRCARSRAVRVRGGRAPWRQTD